MGFISTVHCPQWDHVLLSATFISHENLVHSNTVRYTCTIWLLYAVCTLITALSVEL